MPTRLFFSNINHASKKTGNIFRISKTTINMPPLGALLLLALGWQFLSDSALRQACLKCTRGCPPVWVLSHGQNITTSCLGSCAHRVGPIGPICVHRCFELDARRSCTEGCRRKRRTAVRDALDGLFRDGDERGDMRVLESADARMARLTHAYNICK